MRWKTSAACSMLAGSLLTGGCANLVIVTDPEGDPVPGAKVYGISLSITAGPNATDSRGRAEVPDTIQRAQWVTVAKPGFATAHVDAPDEWPLRVVLQPSALD